MNTAFYLDDLIQRYPVLSPVKEDIRRFYEMLKDTFESGGKLLVAGNGGSCADAEHIVGELAKGFCKKRHVTADFAEKLAGIDPELGPKLAEGLERGLPALALHSHPGLTTAFLNDVNGDWYFGQQLLAQGKKGDIFLAISTSGKSRNIYAAAVVARAMNIPVLGLLGKTGRKVLPLCDAAVVVPEMETFKIQELHLPIYHTLCLMLEEHFFPGE